MTIFQALSLVTYGHSNQKTYENARADRQSSLPVMLIFEQPRVLEGSVCWHRFQLQAGEVGVQRVKPPTTVSCAPRRMAFGSKFDMVRQRAFTDSESIVSWTNWLIVNTLIHSILLRPASTTKVLITSCSCARRTSTEQPLSDFSIDSFFSSTKS